jgi:hypothetical protein
MSDDSCTDKSLTSREKNLVLELQFYKKNCLQVKC